MRVVFDVMRGAVIGVAEVVPGVSGGTVALIVRVYHTIIASASGVVRGILGVGIPRLRDSAPWADVSWGRILPILGGMFVAIFVAARLLEPLLNDFPVESRAVFAGLITMSLVVPISMAATRWTATDVVVAGLAAVVSFFLVGLPGLISTEPSWWLVAPAAAVAVCALVLPGVSGSFLLVTLGMYEPTLQAVNRGDLTYLGVFVAGAIVGLGSFVVVLQWLLANRKRVTLVVMTGLMVGSLRALWPWQTDARELLAPEAGSVALAAGLFFGGMAVVALLLMTERLLAKPSSQLPTTP